MSRHTDSFYYDILFHLHAEHNLRGRGSFCTIPQLSSLLLLRRRCWHAVGPELSRIGQAAGRGLSTAIGRSRALLGFKSASYSLS